jgi:hypothetical protein
VIGSKILLGPPPFFLVCPSITFFSTRRLKDLTTTRSPLKASSDLLSSSSSHTGYRLHTICELYVHPLSILGQRLLVLTFLSSQLRTVKRLPNKPQLSHPTPPKWGMFAPRPATTVLIKLETNNPTVRRRRLTSTSSLSATSIPASPPP